jgi:hypothetical protein
MSYLDVPRIHFFGQFLANPGTLNNILANYDPHNPARPLWNPKGVALFQLQGKNVKGTPLKGCLVTSVLDAEGRLVKKGDPLVGAAVQSNAGTPAKIVDLDPEQQLISQLFGLQLSVVLPGGAGGFTMRPGEHAAVPSLTDLWFVRQPEGGPSGVFQTVLQPDQIEWNDPGSSPLLQQFQEACCDGISVKFTTDLYSMSNSSSTFNIGRIAGAFGPARPGEPVRFPTRKLVPQPPDGGNPQQSDFWSCPFAVDEKRGKAVFDLANSFQIRSNPKTAVLESVPVGAVTAVILQGGQPIPLKPTLNYHQNQYLLTAGIVEADLDADQLAAIRENPVGLLTSRTGQEPVLREAETYVNLSQTFLRLSPGDEAEVQLHAYRFGKPLAGQQLPMELILPGFFAKYFPQFPGLDDQLNPEINQPAAGLTLDLQTGSSGETFVETGADGIAALKLKANAPQPLPQAREIIDSQVYFVSGPWQGSAYFWWPMSFAPLTVLVFNEYTIPDAPTWQRDVLPVMDEYMRLYPGMKDILDMTQYDVVQQNAQRLQQVFSAGLNDPARMPVTRDLAPAKMQMVLKWLAAGLPQ